jgi:ribosome-interacting GTPase 1
LESGSISQPPNIVFKKEGQRVGSALQTPCPLTHIDHDEIKAVMGEYKISSADIAIRCDATIDDLIDVLEAKSQKLYSSHLCIEQDRCHLDRRARSCYIGYLMLVQSQSEHGWNVDELLEQM